jgi:hypothetical protein
MFVGSYTSARLALTTPPECCCNCGSLEQLEFVDTPMKRVRFFFVVGTELTLTQSFPYCRPCKRSATRLPHGWFARFLVFCLVTACVSVAAGALPRGMPSLIVDNLFKAVLVLSGLLTFGYYATRKPKRPGATYYQPVSLTDAWIGDRQVGQVELAFHNARYANVMRRANADLIDAGFLKIQ